MPVILGSSIRAGRVSATLFDAGINVQPILYPIVPEGGARLRFFLSSEHQEADIAHTLRPCRRRAPITLFTLESLANAEAVHEFVAANPGRIALLGVSDPHRPAMGGMVGQMLRHVRRSGLGFLPYLAVNFALPGLLRRRNRLSDLCRRHGIPVHRVRDVNGARQPRPSGRAERN